MVLQSSPYFFYHVYTELPYRETKLLLISLVYRTRLCNCQHFFQKCTAYSIHCTLYSLQYSAYSIHCKLNKYNVQLVCTGRAENKPPINAKTQKFCIIFLCLSLLFLEKLRKITKNKYMLDTKLTQG